MTAYVHIGTCKTGSTTIQEFLWQNRDILSKQEVYSQSCRGGNTPLFYLGDFDYPFTDIKNQVTTLKNELRNCPYDKVILSNENLQRFRLKENIITFKQSLQELGFNDFKIIVYLREPLDTAVSMYNQHIKGTGSFVLFDNQEQCLEFGKHLCNHKQTLQWWSEIFGKENVIPRLFNKEDFIEGDLLKDFIFALGLEWDSEFKIPEKLNETIDLLGVEIGRGIKKYQKIPVHLYGFQGFQKHFTLTDQSLKYLPPKSVALKYLEYFAPSNEWVREHYFPHKKTLFPPKDMTNYKENNHLTTMKEEYWERIGGFIVDIVDSKNEIIKQQQFTLNYGTAKTRISNYLSYKIGNIMIKNARSFLGFVKMPLLLIGTILSHQEQLKAYQETIQNNPNLKLPPLESYPDYKEALKLKNHLSYKLGEAILKAKSIGWLWGGGNLFVIRNLSC